MPKFLEQKLKSRYGADSKVPYKIMNSIGAMHGNKETSKGAAMQAKHESDEKHGKKSSHKKGKHPAVKGLKTAMGYK